MKHMHFIARGDGLRLNYRTLGILAISLIVVGVTCVLSGCGGLDLVWGLATAHANDVTERDDLWGELRRGGEYRLKREFLLVDDNAPPKGLSLWRVTDPPGSGSMPSPDEYRKNPANWPEIKGVVEAGTRVKASKLITYGAPGYGRSLHPYAVILDGAFRDTLVEISDFRSWSDAEKGPKGMLLPKLDYRFVEVVVADEIRDDEQ